MTSLVSKGRTGVEAPWLKKIWIRSHEAVHVVPTRKLLCQRFIQMMGGWVCFLKRQSVFWSTSTVSTNNTMHFIIWSHMIWLSKSSAPLNKHHLDQHLRDLSTDRWIEEEESDPPPMRRMALSLGSGTSQVPYPLSLNVKLFASPGGRRESWLKYHVREGKQWRYKWYIEYCNW